MTPLEKDKTIGVKRDQWFPRIREMDDYRMTGKKDDYKGRYREIFMVMELYSMVLEWWTLCPYQHP